MVASYWLRPGNCYRLPQLICRNFWGTETELSLAVMTHILIHLFERKLGWLEAVTIGPLRYRILITAGIISHPQGQTVIKLAVPLWEESWCSTLWDKLAAAIPNCIAVENRPPESNLDLIIDKYATHKHPEVRDFHLHFMPISSSWMNMVERLFRDLTFEVVRTGVLKALLI